MASIGESDGDSNYCESAVNSPMSPANTPDLEGHISELEEMHEVAEGDLVELARPMVLFSLIDELKLPELDNAKTDLPESHQENVDTLLVNNQPSKTPQWPQRRPRHVHASRPENPPFKRKRETSQTSAYSVPTTFYMVSTRIGCTKIDETT